MKDLLDAVSTRIKTPYFGYAILSFFALNWRGIFLLVTTEGTPQERLAAFDCATNQYTLIIWPLVVGTLVAASTHWIQLIFIVISKKPAGLIDNLRLEAEHLKTIRQTELEQSRSDLFAVKEQELIGRAKRDEEVAGIEDEEAKEKLATQIEILRRERDQLSAQLKNQTSADKPTVYNLSPVALELLKATSEDKDGRLLKPRSIGNRSIQAGKKSLGSKDSRDFAKYDGALDELVIHGLVKNLGGKGEVYELTDKGWKIADAL